MRIFSDIMSFNMNGAKAAYAHIDASYCLHRGSPIPPILAETKFDVILCSDVLYDECLYGSLEATLHSLNCDIIIFTLKMRNPM